MVSANDVERRFVVPEIAGSIPVDRTARCAERGRRVFVPAMGVRKSLLWGYVAAMLGSAVPVGSHSAALPATSPQVDCGPRHYRARSELCAQWKAADAAEDSAWWAWVSGVMGMASLAGVVAALALTANSNRIARDAARRQLRAYIGLESCEITPLDDRSGFILTATFINAGQTPAYRLKLMGESFAAEYPLAAEHPFIPHVGGYETPLAPGQSIGCSYRLRTNDVDEAMRAVVAGETGLYIQGVCLYEDAFGRSRDTTFCYVFGGRVANSGGLVMHAAESGNSAT